jgi:putative sterol carrier protein
MTIDIQKMLNEDLPGAIAKNPDAAKAIGKKFQLNIGGDGGGEWYIDATDSGPSAVSGNPGGADCTIDIASEDFMKLVADPSAGMGLFFSGKLKVKGDQMAAMKLQKLLELGSS